MSARRTRSNQQGQAIVIGAVAFVAMIGVAGLAVDGGRAYVDRRSLQAAADSAADAAMRMVLKDYHDVRNGAAQSFNDCDIKAQVDQIASKPNTSSADSGLDGTKTVVKFTDQDGNVVTNPAADNNTGAPFCPPMGSPAPLNICTDPGAAAGSCVAGVKNEPQYQQATYFLNSLGIPAQTQKATATSIFKISGPNPGGFSPFVIWHEACGSGDLSPEDPLTWVGPDTDPLEPTDVVIFRENHWAKPGSGSTATNCGSGKRTASSSYKGGITTNSPFEIRTVGIQSDCSDSGNPVMLPTVKVGDCIGSLGNGNGSVPPAPAAGSNVFMPIIDGITGQGNGSSYRAHVVGFVAMTINADQSSGTIRFVCKDAVSSSDKCVVPDALLQTGSGFLK